MKLIACVQVVTLVIVSLILFRNIQSDAQYDADQAKYQNAVSQYEKRAAEWQAQLDKFRKEIDDWNANNDRF